MAETQKLDELQWRSPEWINAFGLRTDNVLEYFSQSPFFDRTSNNQVIKMQNQFTNQNFYNTSYETTLKELSKMKGIEFIIAMVKEPDFWIVRKQNRISEIETVSISDYYIIGSSIYMAPLIHSIVSSRLLSTALNLRDAMGILQKLPSFSPSTGHTYDFTTKVISDTPATTSTATTTATTASTTTDHATTTKSKTSKQLSQDEENTLPHSSAVTFNNLLNLSMTNNSVYLDDVSLPSTQQSNANSNPSTRAGSQPPSNLVSSVPVVISPTVNPSASSNIITSSNSSNSLMTSMATINGGVKASK